MKAKSMVLIMIALGCGLVAAFGVNQMVVQGGTEKEEVKKKPVLVVSSLITIADEITEDNVKVEHWPVEMVPEGALESIKDAKDKLSKSRIVKGQTLVEEMLGTEDEVLRIDVPPGMRVMAIKVSTEDIVEGLIQPGDRVDITGVFRIEGTQRAKTFLRDVQVFSVGKKLDRIIDPDGKSQNAKTVSLLVKPDQVEKLVVAKRSGSLLLSMRNQEDVDEEGYSKDGYTDKDVAGILESTEEREGREEDEGGFTDLLDNITRAKNDPFMPTGLPEPPKPQTMIVMTSDGAKVYTWNDPNGLPEVTDGSAGAIAPIAPPAIPLPPTTGTGQSTGNNPPPTGETPVNEPIEEDE